MGVTAEQVRELVETDWSDAAIARAIRDAQADVARYLGPAGEEVTETCRGGSGAHLRWPAGDTVTVDGKAVQVPYGAQYLPGVQGVVTYETALTVEAAEQVVLDMVILTLSYRGAIKQWSDGSLSEAQSLTPQAYRAERAWLLRHPAGGRSVV